MLDRLAAALLHYTDRQVGQNPFMKAIDGMAIVRSDHPNPPSPMILKPAMCVVAQGAKWTMFGDTKLEYPAGQALLVNVETPALGRVVAASPEEPCLVLAFEPDLAILRSVAEGLEATLQAGGEPGRGVFVTDF